MPHRNYTLQSKTDRDAAYPGIRHNTGAHDVAEEHIPRLHDPPHRGLLVGAERDRRARAGDRQVIAGERAQAMVIELAIVERDQPLATFVVLPNPFCEPVLDFLLLLPRAFGRARIDPWLTFVVGIIDGRGP